MQITLKQRTFLLFVKSYGNESLHFWIYCRDKDLQKEFTDNGYVRLKFRLRIEIESNIKNHAIMHRRCNHKFFDVLKLKIEDIE